MKIRFPQDPYAQREQKKYSSPIPSREYILICMKDYAKPIAFKQLFSDLGLSSKADREALEHRLQAMIRAGQVLKNRQNNYALSKELQLIVGTVSVQRQGFGFLIPEDPKQADVFLSAAQVKNVLDGDKVLIYCQKQRGRNKPEGVIVRVLNRKHKQVTGRIEIREKNIYYLVVDSIKGKPHFLITHQDPKDTVKDNTVAVAKIVTYPSFDEVGTVELVKSLGDYFDPGLEIDTAIHAYQIPYEWPQSIIQEAAQVSSRLEDDSDPKRVDLTSKAFITIDGEDAQDFDDAVYCEQKSSGDFILYVAIADVSHYVNLNSAMDEEAKRRGNSVYFPGRVVPMLPEILSNDLCSLKPNVNRLAFACRMEVSKQGVLNKATFCKALIHSKGRFTYKEVANILTDSDSVIKMSEEKKALVPNISCLHQLYLKLMEQRLKRGAIDFNTKENQVLFTKQKKIKAIVPAIRTVAHRIIEECMLLTNLATANFVTKHKLPILYRNHPVPKEEKLTELRTFLNDFGLTIKGGQNPSPKEFMLCLQEIAKRPDRDTLEMVVLRSLNQACYAPENIGHFGLAYEQYVHFTSPIRRYADLLVHRLMTYQINKEAYPDSLKEAETLQQLGHQISATEQRATEATRDVLLWLKCEYMHSKVGQTFSGRVTGVTQFGLFVEIDDVFVEGLVHIASLNNDYYRYDKARHLLVGEQSNEQYTLGQRLDVIVAAVNVEDRKIDYELLNKKNKTIKQKSHKSFKKRTKQNKHAPKKNVRSSKKVKTKKSKIRTKK